MDSISCHIRGLDKFIYLRSLNRVKKERSKESRKEEHIILSHYETSGLVVQLTIFLCVEENE
jgi:hypothetical protein